jgi:hypothetical protein
MKCLECKQELSRLEMVPVHPDPGREEHLCVSCWCKLSKGNVASIDQARERRKAELTVMFSAPEDIGCIATRIVNQSDGKLHVALWNSKPGDEGWTLTPDQADELALKIVRHAEAARRGDRVL